MAERLARGVGYCCADECDDRWKGVFLMNHGPVFICPRCRRDGLLEPEIGTSAGPGPDQPYWSVRVEFDYCPVTRRYRRLAVVSDLCSDPESNVYTLRSPLVRTEKRATVLATSLLARLNRAAPPDDGPMPTGTAELILNVDQAAPTPWAQQMAALERHIERRS